VKHGRNVKHMVLKAQHKTSQQLRSRGTRCTRKFPTHCWFPNNSQY